MHMNAIGRATARASLAVAAGWTLPSISQAQTAARHEAVANWPMPLPNQWVLGGLGENRGRRIHKFGPVSQ
jgi:hypothetical protein